MNKSELKPSCVFEQFARINEIPRPSKHEGRMIEFLKEFGKANNLDTKVDETGNVLISKPATPGYENRRQWFSKAIWIWYARSSLTWISISIKMPFKLI